MLFASWLSSLALRSHLSGFSLRPRRRAQPNQIAAWVEVLEDKSLLTAYAGVAGSPTNPVLIPHNTPTQTQTHTFYGMYGDMDGHAVTVSITTAPTKGTLVDNGDQSFTYTANVNEVGSDTFVFSVSDSIPGNTDAVGSVHLTLGNFNAYAGTAGSPTNPVQIPHSTPTMPQSLTFYEMYGDMDGDAVTVSVTTGPTKGTLVDNGDKSFTYTANVNQVGPDSFAFSVTDSLPGTTVVTGNVHLTLGNFNAYAGTAGSPTNPVLIPHSTPTTTQSQTFYEMYGDMDGDAVTVSITTAPTKGTLVDNGDKSFTYTANVNQVGPDSFAFSVTDSLPGTTAATGNVHITLGNFNAYAGTAGSPTNPVLIPHSTPTTTQTQTFYEMYGDMDGDAVTVSITTGPTKGTLVDNGDRSFTYTANVNQVGPDSFAFSVTDSLPGTTAVTGNVHLTLGNFNAYAGTAGSPTNPVQIPHSTPTTPQSQTFYEMYGDMDGDTVTVSVTTGPTKGTLVDNGDRSFTYTANVNQVGPDSFAFSVTDSLPGTTAATGSVHLMLGNNTPMPVADSYSAVHDEALALVAPGVLWNDNDADGDLLTVSLVDYPENGWLSLNSDGTFIYLPNGGYVGNDSFTYRVFDGFAWSMTLATVTIEVGNQSPIAVNDLFNEVPTSLTTSFDVSELLGNDWDPDDPSEALELVSIASTSSLGAMITITSGVVTYDPTGASELQNLGDEMQALDFVQYRIKDPQGAEAIAFLQMAVSKKTRPKITAPPDQITLKDKPTSVLKIQISDFDTTAANSATLSLARSSSNQSVVPDSGLALGGSGLNRTIQVTPVIGAVGEATITLTVTDADGLSATATFKVTVEANLRILRIATLDEAALLGDGTGIANNYDVSATSVSKGKYSQFKAVLNDATYFDLGQPLPVGVTLTWNVGMPGSSGLERKVLRDSAQKVDLTATLGADTVGMYVYVIGVSHTGFAATPGTHFADNADAFKGPLGVLVPTPNTGVFTTNMESQWTVGPPSVIADQGTIFNKAGIAFIPHRELRSLRYESVNGSVFLPIQGGDGRTGNDSKDWDKDTTRAAVENPWPRNGHLYHNDKPGHSRPSFIGGIDFLFYDNFRERFEVKLAGVTSAVPELADWFYWHAFRRVVAVNGTFTNAAGGTNELASGNIFWGVLPAFLSNKMPTFATTTLADGQVGVPYSQQIMGIAPSDFPSATLVFSISNNDGSLSSYLTLNPNGTISGTALEAGTFTFTVKLTADVSDPNAVSNYRQFSITIAP